MDIVTAAEIINSLNEASYPIPSTAVGLNELKCKAEEELENGTLKTGIALRTDSGALKITIRRKTEGGGRAGAASRHTCSINHFCDGDSSGERPYGFRATRTTTLKSAKARSLY